jgi:DNA-binding GntR family transcriptional regulator
MPAKRKELKSSQVYAALKEMIADYRFQPGARLNVEKLAREFRLSRIPVWEAVRRLEQEGLLQTIPNRGVFMAEMTLERAFELFQVRGALERLAGRLAAEKMDKRTLAKAEKCLFRQLKVVEKGDLVGYSQADYEFHSLIYRSTGNRTLEEMLESVKTKMQPVGLQVSPILINLYEDHRAIFEGLRKKDPERVERAFQGHNQRVLERIIEEIQASRKRRKGVKDFQKSLRHF